MQDPIAGPVSSNPFCRHRPIVKIGVAVPAIVSQELFERVQAKLQEGREKYRHPITHYLLRGLLECGECGAACSSYRRYVTKSSPSASAASTTRRCTNEFAQQSVHALTGEHRALSQFGNRDALQTEQLVASLVAFVGPKSHKAGYMSEPPVPPSGPKQPVVETPPMVPLTPRSADAPSIFASANRKYSPNSASRA